MDQRPWWAFLIITLLVGSGIALADSPANSPTEADLTTDTITVTIGGGTLTYPADLPTGPRWLQPLVPDLPDPYLIRPDGSQVPGDGKDSDDLVVTERRITDHDHHNRPQTRDIIGQGIHGSPDAWICICDIELILWNNQSPIVSLFRMIDSSYLWVDNITVYGGGLYTRFSQHITVSHSTFIDGGGVFNDHGTDIRVHGNDFVFQKGILQFYDHPQVLDECWPNDVLTCTGNAVSFWGGARGLVDQNHFSGGGGVGSTVGVSDLRAIHNSFYNSGFIMIGPSSEASWNLIRGWESGAQIQIASGNTPGSPVWVHNNSLVFPHEIDIGGNGYQMSPGIRATGCACVIEYNDLIGYGLAANIMFNNEYLQHPALIADLNSIIHADNNHWGTIHDPRLPPDWWIQERRGGQAIVSNWFTEPIHPVSISATFDLHEAPHWVHQILNNEPPLPA